MNLMEAHRDKLRLATIVLFCLVCIGFGLYAWQMPMLLGGAVGMLYVAIVMIRLSRSAQPVETPLPISGPAIAADPRTDPCTGPPADPSDTGTLVRSMLCQSRHALLLRKQVVGNLDEDQFHETCEQLHARMALVPEGDVLLDRTNGASDDELAIAGRRFRVTPLFLDRYPVTNRQYYQFVAAGGYGDLTLWDSQAWPVLVELVDQTGQPAPAFWQNGRYLPGEEDLPVVGVSWYEAQAAARWMGKRLPTDAEWVKAACWPVATDSAAMVQRRFPWGDGLDRSRANLWGSGPDRVVAVTEFPAGASVGGIYQLVGNVWEWTANDFCPSTDPNCGGARAVEEHPRRGFRHLLRKPGHLPIRKRRISLEPTAQYRLPLRHQHVRTRAGPAAGRAGRAGRPGGGRIVRIPGRRRTERK